jgi:hypothetical protein
MGHYGVVRAKYLVGVSPETFLLLQGPIMPKVYQMVHKGKQCTPFAGGDPGASLMVPAGMQQVPKEYKCTKS